MKAAERLSSAAAFRRLLQRFVRHAYSIFMNFLPLMTMRFLQAGQLTPSDAVELMTSVPHHGHSPFSAPNPMSGPRKGASNPARMSGTPMMAPIPVRQSSIPRGMRQPVMAIPVRQPTSAPSPNALWASVSSFTKLIASLCLTYIRPQNRGVARDLIAAE